MEETTQIKDKRNEFSLELCRTNIEIMKGLIVRHMQ